MGALHYTEDQFRQANAVSALEYARSRGYQLQPHANGYYRLAAHDSMVFGIDGSWYWNSQGLHGRALAFAVHYERMSWPEAVLTLCDALPDSEAKPTAYSALPRSSAVTKARPIFELPPPAPSMRAAFAYLIQTRGLDREIISELVKNHQIYESDRTLENGSTVKNVVFVGLDETFTPRSAFQRSCNPASSFKLETAGSDKAYPFAVYGDRTATTLFVFEAAIDAISHATYYKLRGLPWKSGHRIAQSGNAPATAMLRMLRLYPVDTVKICTDNDTGGTAIGEKLYRALEGKFAGSIAYERPPAEYKDWNDYLCQIKKTGGKTNGQAQAI